MAYRPRVAPRGVAVPIAGGDRMPVRLVNGVRNTGLFLVARATVQVSVAAATTLRNRGSVWSLFSEIVLDENGTDKMVIQGNVARYASEMVAPSALSAVRAGVGIATYQLEEAILIGFADPLSLDPLETSFLEHDARQALQVSFRAYANLAAQLFTVGPATVAVTGLTVSVEQNYDAPMQGGLKAPLFIPYIRQQVDQIVGDVAQQPIYIRTPNLIRQLIVSQEDSVLGEVPDVLRALTLRGDYSYIIGPAPMTLNDLVLRQEMDMGGAVVTSNRAHTGFRFQRYGQLSECLNPTQDVNLRLEVSALPSVLGVAAGGTSRIRTTSFELVRDAQVTAPNVPFAY